VLYESFLDKQVLIDSNCQVDTEVIFDFDTLIDVAIIDEVVQFEEEFAEVDELD